MTKYGYQKRQQQRTQKHKTFTQDIYEVCDKHYQAFCQKLTDNAKVSDTQIYQLYDDIYQELLASVGAGAMPKALLARLHYFNKQNRQRQKLGLDNLPSPTIAYQPQRPANINTFETFLYLQHTQNMVSVAITQWQTQRRFSAVQTLAWLIFSLMVFLGHNDTRLSYAVYQALTKRLPLYRLPSGDILLSLDIDSPNYTNQRIHKNQQDISENKTLSHTRWVIWTGVSLLWLSYWQRHFGELKSFPSWGACLKQLSDIIGEKVTPDTLAKSSFVRHNHLYWQTLPQVRIDEQLVWVLTGKQRQTAIRQDQLLNFFKPVNLKKCVLTDHMITALSIVSKVSGAENGVARTPLKEDFVKVLRKALSASNSSPKSIIAQQLTELWQQPLAPNHKRLLTWIQRLHQDGNKASTQKRYLSEIGNDFLNLTAGATFDDWQAEDYMLLYDNIIQKKRKPSYVTAVLKSLHHTLKQSFGAPDVPLCGQSDPLVVATALIPPELYQALLQNIAKSQLSDYYKQMLSVAFILLYRTAMRVSELLGLQMTDVECVDKFELSDASLIVRSNSYRELKSDDGARRLALSVLLKPDELKAFARLFGQRQITKSRYLFTPQYEPNPLSSHSLHQALNALLGGDYLDISLHSFRHNAISVMAMLLRIDDWRLLDNFSDYTPSKIQAVRQHFLGRVRTVSPSYWEALMSFAGHASLDTTFASYVHTADVIASHQMAQAQLCLPANVVMLLSGKQKRSFNEHQQGAFDPKAQTVNIAKIKHLLTGDIHAITLSKKPKDIKRQALTPDPNIQNPKSLSVIFTHHHYKQLEQFLQEIESGVCLEDAYYPDFEYTQAKALYDRALSLVQDKDGHAIYKLIGKERKTKSAHPLIAPTPLHYHQEQALVQRCFDNIEQLCQSGVGYQQIQWFIQMFYDKVMMSKSQIRFTFKERQSFYAYVKIAFKILPSAYWRINICQLYGSGDNKDTDNDKTNQINQTKTEKHLLHFQKQFKDCQAQITRLPNYNGYGISVIRPNEKGKPTPNQPASALMRYVCHLLLIEVVLK